MTPLEKFNSVYLKREDKNLTGSAKDRAIIEQLKNLQKQKYSQAVISSTGNAAISAAHVCHLQNIKLTVFISPSINPQKLKLISASVIKSKKAISDAIKFAKKNHAYNLRQSTNPSALLGYRQIGEEILEQLPQVSSIFIPVGSGTTLLGIAQALPKNIKVFGVQSAANPTIAKYFVKNYKPENKIITDALTVKSLPLKNKIINIIKKHQSTAFIINNQAIIESQKLLKGHFLSSESALCLAAYKQNASLAGNYPVIVCTGTQRQ